MKNSSLPIVATALTIILPHVTQAAEPYTETWDGGSLAGWRSNTTQTNVELRSTGGNPAGYLYTWGEAMGGSWDIGAQTNSPVFMGDYGAVGIALASVNVSFLGGVFDAAWVRFGDSPQGQRA